MQSPSRRAFSFVPGLCMRCERLPLTRSEYAGPIVSSKLGSSHTVSGGVPERECQPKTLAGPWVGCTVLHIDLQFEIRSACERAGLRLTGPVLVTTAAPDPATLRRPPHIRTRESYLPARLLPIHLLTMSSHSRSRRPRDVSRIDRVIYIESATPSASELYEEFGPCGEM